MLFQPCSSFHPEKCNTAVVASTSAVVPRICMCMYNIDKQKIYL